jgi:hypothetical protein
MGTCRETFWRELEFLGYNNKIMPRFFIALVAVVCAYGQPTLYDQVFLQDLTRRSFQFFWENADPNTGLVLDRARTDGSPELKRNAGTASIAVTGFGLTALCIGAEHGWVAEKEIRDRVRTTLRFFAERSPHEHGWFYHWMDAKTGARRPGSELSSIDTALLMGGILTARQKFRDDPEIFCLATAIYERIDFPWMLDGESTLSHGWSPEAGFLKYRWSDTSEHLILYLLAIGSPTHPIRPESWYAWRRDFISYGGYTYLQGSRLFHHQYSQAWINFRGRREKTGSRIDYFDDAVKATRANRQFCLDLRRDFPGYSDNIWGITPSDSARGYVAWGGPPRGEIDDGTVVPCAPAGSLMFTPDISLPALEEMKNRFGDRIYGKYGFADAFNPNTGWVAEDVIGIDVGITILSAENLRNGAIWRWFEKNNEVPRAMNLVGLDKYQESIANR